MSFYCEVPLFSDTIWIGEPHNPFPNYRYTGELKAVYPLSPRREVPEGIMRRK